MSEDSGIRELAGRYRLITRLGKRMMRGWDLHLRRVVAVRLIPAPDGSDQVAERACGLVDLAHPGLVRVLDAGNADGEPFLVAEFIAGTTLKARLQDGPLPAATVGQMGVTLAKALAYAHSHQVTHRDFRPGNILLGPGDEPYLTDLAIAETTTPSYMAPEQVDGAPPDEATDIYGFGLVLLESLTGRTEYPGKDAASIRARLTHPPQVPPDLPFAQAIEAMTATDPADRPDAATCVDLLRGDSAKARVQTRVVLAAAVAAAVVATTVALIVGSSDNTSEPPRQASVENPLRQIPSVTVTPQVPVTNSAGASVPDIPPQQDPGVAVSGGSTPPQSNNAVGSPADDAYINLGMAPAMYPPPRTTTTTQQPPPPWLVRAIKKLLKPTPPGQAKKSATPTTTTPPGSGQATSGENENDDDN
jgi:eukaryotic-like serine/threonine-protein kinase